MQYITDVSDKYARGKWRGIGASFLIKLFDDETTVCSEMGNVSTAQASLNHLSSNTTAGYLAYKFEGDAPQKKWQNYIGRRQTEGGGVLELFGQELNIIVKVHAPLAAGRKSFQCDARLSAGSCVELHLVHVRAAVAAWPFTLQLSDGALSVVHDVR